MMYSIWAPGWTGGGGCGLSRWGKSSARVFPRAYGLALGRLEEHLRVIMGDEVLRALRALLRTTIALIFVLAEFPFSKLEFSSGITWLRVNLPPLISLQASQ
ncbi:hypothetical protein CPSG_04300 [Coccidioides posadasii str. Silveira]|uniref:Uncharacterized protein n=1 Tax=Coccidioides posadasii (strain RMSCC 757 / Silveira) TaxID=443226 RepID=E9D3W1_COCPS|nr:hypothetical protein CPSG_04300 [Coccidioides posadasii str. Silveira]